MAPIESDREDEGDEDNKTNWAMPETIGNEIKHEKKEEKSQRCHQDWKRYQQISEGGVAGTVT